MRNFQDFWGSYKINPIGKIVLLSLVVDGRDKNEGRNGPMPLSDIGDKCGLTRDEVTFGCQNLISMDLGLYNGKEKSAFRLVGNTQALDMIKIFSSGMAQELKDARLKIDELQADLDRVSQKKKKKVVAKRSTLKKSDFVEEIAEQSAPEAGGFDV